MLQFFNKKTAIQFYSLYTWIIFAFLISNLFTHAEASREVSGKRECSTCHIMWLKDFNRKDVTPLIPYEPKPVVATGKQDVSSTNAMCFSCHDGFVLDSRKVWKSNRHNHPVGMKPSKRITIPTSKGKVVFPLNDDGKVYCGTCHSAHGVDWNQSESPVFLRVKNVESSMCLSCHLGKGTGPKEGNHPVFKRPPNKPHKLIAAGAKFAKDGDVICQSCHDPHSAANDKILLITDKDSELCFTCHKDKRTIEKTKHNLNRTAPDATNMKGKTVSASGICASCHLPHSAKGPMLWARERINVKDRASAPCIGCHRENGLARDKTLGTHTHPTGRSVNKLGIQIKKGKWYSEKSQLKGKGHVDLPLYSNWGQKIAGGDKVSCGSCHDPHVWSKSGQASLSENDELLEGNRQSSFLRMNQDKNSTLCINCHLKKKTILSSKHNIFNDAKIPQKDILTGGVCAQCHIPHNAKGSYLRARDQQTTKGNLSRLCESCHSKGKIAKDKLTGDYSHPIGVTLEKINSNTKKLPLYDDKGNKVENGRVDCATCHDAHTWAPDVGKTVNQLKEGDATTSFLRISASHKSKLCLECHKDKNMVLGTDHDMSVSKPETVNHQGQNTAHSGVCGQCHSVHNATMPINLWAREPAKVASAVEKMCLSCHAKGKPAELKIPVVLRHPEKITVWSNKVREKRINSNKLPNIPVFGKNGKHAHVGLITCLSCHDPHQWQPGISRAGTGKNREGDAMTSFLRNKNTELIICADCHGADAIFRYKYFHGKTSRREYPLYQ